MESSASSNRPFEDSKQVLLDLNVALKDPDLSDETSKRELKKVEPEWLEKFIGRKFFDRCSYHSVRNAKNNYCVDCDVKLCHYCVAEGPHEGHELLKLYRHAYNDVTPVNAIAQLFDCSQIQPYKCNKRKVLALASLPSLNSKIWPVEESCLTCKRKLINSRIYSYCSISCKVDAYTKKEDDDLPPFLILGQEHANTADENAEPEAEPLELSANVRPKQAEKRPRTRLDELAEAATQQLGNAETATQQLGNAETANQQLGNAETSTRKRRRRAIKRSYRRRPRKGTPRRVNIAALQQ